MTAPAPTVNTVTITNGNQLPRWTFLTLPDETTEQAVARIAAAFPEVRTITVYVLAGQTHIQHPESEA